MRSMKVLKVFLLGLFLIFFSFSGQAIGGSIKNLVLKPTPGKTFPAASQVGVKKKIVPATKAASDLSIERIYLKGCTIHVVIKNLGPGELTQSDYERGQLVLKTKHKKHVFTLKKVDKRGLLRKSGGVMDFDTKIQCAEREKVEAYLKDLKEKRDRGRFSVLLIPSGICIKKEVAHKPVVPSALLKERHVKGSTKVFRKVSSATSHVGVEKGIVTAAKAASDLSIERVYLKGCNIHVLIKNRGTGGVSEKEYEKGKLVMVLTRKGKVAKYFSARRSFFLEKIDFKRILKRPGAQLDFDTKIPCTEKLKVEIKLEGLKGKGKKSLVKILVPSKNCLMVQMAKSSVFPQVLKERKKVEKFPKALTKEAPVQKKIHPKAKETKRFKTTSKMPSLMSVAGTNVKSRKELLKSKINKMLPLNCSNGEFLFPKHGAEYYYYAYPGFGHLNVFQDSERESGNAEERRSISISWRVPCAYIEDFRNFEVIYRTGILKDFDEFINEKTENHTYAFYLKGIDDGSFYPLKFFAGMWVLPYYALDELFNRSPEVSLRYQIIVNVMDKNDQGLDGDSVVATYRSGIFKLTPGKDNKETRYEFGEEMPPAVGTYPVVLNSFTIERSDLLHGEDFYIKENVPGGRYHGLIVRHTNFSFKTIDGRNITDVCSDLNITVYVKIVVLKENYEVHIVNQVFQLSEDELCYIIEGDTLRLRDLIIPLDTGGSFKQAIISFRLGFCGRSNFEVPGRVIGYEGYRRDEAKSLEVHLGDIVYGKYLRPGENHIKYYAECHRNIGCFGLSYWDPISYSWKYLGTKWGKSGVWNFVFPETLRKEYVGDTIKLKIDWCSQTFQGYPDCKCDEDFNKDLNIDSDVRSYPFRNIVVSSPKLFETWYIGFPYTIRWASSSSEGKVEIYFCHGVGLCTSRDLIARVPDTGSYTWNIDTARVPHWGSNRVIKIVKAGSSPVIAGYSEKFHLIFPRIRIISPEGGERVVKYKSFTLIWDVEAPLDKMDPSVSLDYRVKENGSWSDWRFIAQVPVGQETYNWDIPGEEISGEVEAQIRIIGRIHDTNGSGPIGAVSNTFTITP